MNYLKKTVVPPKLKFNVDFRQYNPTTADGTKTTAKVCGSSKDYALKGGHTPGWQHISSKHQRAETSPAVEIGLQIIHII